MLMDAAPGHSLVYHLSLFSRQAAKQQHRHHKPKNRLGWVTRPLLAFLVSLPSTLPPAQNVYITITLANPSHKPKD